MSTNLKHPYFIQSFLSSKMTESKKRILLLLSWMKYCRDTPYLLNFMYFVKLFVNRIIMNYLQSIIIITIRKDRSKNKINFTECT